jgi:hypothetical protein
MDAVTAPRTRVRWIHSHETLLVNRSRCIVPGRPDGYVA